MPYDKELYISLFYVGMLYAVPVRSNIAWLEGSIACSEWSKILYR